MKVSQLLLSYGIIVSIYIFELDNVYNIYSNFIYIIATMIGDGVQKSMKNIVIVGRENVGKSTLFNKLCRKNYSITNDKSGVTHDYIMRIGQLKDLYFRVVDTPGWNTNQLNVIDKQIQNNIIVAINTADIILFIVDAKNPLTNDDILFAKIVRKIKKPIFLIANKAESNILLDQKELKKLKFGDATFISSEHKLHFEKIYELVKTHIIPTVTFTKNECDISIAIIGRMNVGKSTLFNSIIGFKRSLTSCVEGTTRDHLEHMIDINGFKFNLIDTAGIRKKTKIKNHIEKISIGKTLDAIKKCNIALLLMEPQNLLEKQDLSLANLVIRNNKLLILIINKQDLISDKSIFNDKVKDMLQHKLPQIKNIKTYSISAKNKLNHRLLFERVKVLWSLYNHKIPTSSLNNWLKVALKNYNIKKVYQNTILRIKYVNQHPHYPLTFSFYINKGNTSSVSNNLKKFLLNSLSTKFSLSGMPIKFYFVASKNPYVSD